MIGEFPPSSSESKVFVMDIEKFFKVKQSTLKNYDLSNYHLFLDDVQHMEFDIEEDDGSLSDDSNISTDEEDDDSLSDDSNSSTDKNGKDEEDDAYVMEHQNNDDDSESLNKESHTVEYRQHPIEDNENNRVSFSTLAILWNERMRHACSITITFGSCWMLCKETVDINVLANFLLTYS